MIFTRKTEGGQSSISRPLTILLEGGRLTFCSCSGAKKLPYATKGKHTSEVVLSTCKRSKKPCFPLKSKGAKVEISRSVFLPNSENMSTSSDTTLPSYPYFIDNSLKFPVKKARPVLLPFQNLLPSRQDKGQDAGSLIFDINTSSPFYAMLRVT